MTTLEGALEVLKSKLGGKYVLTDKTTLQEYQTATFSTAQQILGVLRPANRKEVQICLKIAGDNNIPLYPISTGRNWGYGSRVPMQDGSMVLDLGRLNRIIDFNETLAYVTLEPGVTQEQLYKYLKERNSNLFFSATGSSPQSSIVGNVIERGLDGGQYSDRFNYTCGVEVALATGEFLQLGFGRFKSAKATPVHKWGVGPYLEGLFSQSNMGVITQMTLWLNPRPEYYQTVWYAADDSQFEGLIDAIRRLKLTGVVRGGFIVSNDCRVLSSRQAYPWAETNGKTPLPDDVRLQLNKKWGLNKWSGEVGIYSPNKELCAAIAKAIAQELQPVVSKLYFFNDEMLNLTQDQFAKRYPGLDMQETINGYENSQKRGIPNESSLTRTYWRKRTKRPATDMNPDRDRCGVIWCAPAVPLTGSDVREAANIIEEVSYKHGFEPNMDIVCATERNTNIANAIIYDRDVPSEDERALECYHDMSKRLTQAGYISYRLGIQGMADLPKPQDDSKEVLARIKNTLDPNHILAPGRYE